MFLFRNALSRAAVTLLLAILLAACAALPTARPRTFVNLELGQGQDPSIVVRDGLYHSVQSGPDGQSLTVRVARSLRTLAKAPATVVWSAGRDGTPCCNYWAPELHYLRGQWVIYFAADQGNNASHRMYAIAANTPQGPYTFKGKLDLADDRWAIDGAVLETPAGDLYMLWSGWPGPVNEVQNLYISRMSDPWTVIGPRVLLSAPIYSWERIGGPPGVNEGPAALVRGDRVWLAYSASGCWTSHYQIGLLNASLSSNLLDPASWRKSPEPVFGRNPPQGVFGPGHNGFFRSPDGREDWMVYHAVDHPNGHCAGERSVRAQKIEWRSDGSPDFGTARALAAEQDLPSGDQGQ